MKKLIKIIVYSFILMLSMDGYSQCVVNTTTTDWNKFNAGAGPSNNDFNWINSGLVYPVYLQDNLDNPSRNVELPYFCTLPGGSGSCGNKNTLAYELLGNTAAYQDIKPEDGWELVLKNFGTPNATPGDNTGRGVANPFFVLYNRYNGKMKTFIALTGIRSGNSALIKVEFEQGSKHTALFSHAEPISKTLKSFDNTNNFNTINEIAQKNFAEDYYWLVSEIQTAYDPCACHRQQGNTSPSVIVVTPIIIQSSAIEAKIEGTLDQQLVDGSGNVVAETSGKTSFKELANAGLKGYNSWNSYKTKAQTFIDKRHQAYKDKLTNDWWEGYEDYIPNNNSNPTQAQKEALLEDFSSSDENFKKLMGIEDPDKYEQTVTTLKGIASLIPYVGAAISVYDLLSQGGEKTTPSTSPSPPMVFSSSFTLDGQITNRLPITNFAFHNPGTISSSNPSGNHLTPVYDNVLGVFNILKEPTFVERRAHSDAVIKFHDGTVSNGELVEITALREFVTKSLFLPLRQFKMTNDIKYVINPASNLSVDLIDACYVLEYDGNDNFFIQSAQSYDSIKAIPFHEGIHDDSSKLPFKERVKSLEKSGFHLEQNSTNHLVGGDAKIRFRTSYVPLNCLNNLNFVLYGGGGVPKLYIKLLIKMRRTDDPNTEGVTQVITYDMGDKLTTATTNLTTIKYLTFFWEHFSSIQITPRPPLHFNNIHSHKVFSLPFSTPYHKKHDVEYNSSIGNLYATGKVTIPDNALIPDNTTITAFEEIIVGENVSFGNNVKLISGRRVNLSPSTSLNPTVEIELNPLLKFQAFNCTSSEVASLKATQTEIDAICNSNKYVQNSGQNKNDPYQYDHQKEDIYITECNIYPNPAKSNVYVNLELEKEMEYTMLITDVQGKTLLQIRKKGRKGKNNTSIDVSTLAPGAYFIQIKGENYKKIDKLIIMR